MSGVSNPPQEEDKKPNDQSAYINLKVKGQSTKTHINIKFVSLLVNLKKMKEINGNGRRDDELKGLIWKLPQIKLKDLAKMGSAFCVGTGCSIGLVGDSASLFDCKNKL
ncbi:uncharacterized protein LOC116122165 [Pistacia vera]|uniref:uncharacterized protein LOC116122165 n=1 Tax=Pistacia vera TaxID=55513 RepID=UPI001262EBD5|nr:uncharacterized protein LOC116122165 [Pistacia vera]